MLLFGVGRMIRLDLPTLAVASQANVGGPASAMALATTAMMPRARHARTLDWSRTDCTMADKPVKYFTLEEATATLPYVSRIVGDIVAEYERWRGCIYRYEVIAANATAEQGETDAQVKLRQEVDTIAQRINCYIEELSGVGCVFKGFEGGLIDFYSKLEGRDIFLCWKLGEQDIGWWHEADAGFAGRQALVPELAEGQQR